MVVAVPDCPVMTSVTVQVTVMVFTPPTVAGVTKVPEAPGKGAVPVEPVVVRVGEEKVSAGLLDTTLAVMLTGCPLTLLLKGSEMVMKPALGGIENGNTVPTAAVVVKLTVAGAVMVSDLPAMTKESKLVRVPVVAIMLIA